MTIQHRDDLHSTIRLLLFPYEAFIEGSVQFYDFHGAYFLTGKGSAERARLIALGRAHPDIFVLLNVVDEVWRELVDARRDDEAWNEFMCTLLRAQAQRKDLDDLREWYGQSDTTEEMKVLIWDVFSQLAEQYYDWERIYQRMGREDVRREAVYRAMLATAQGIRDRLSVLRDVAPDFEDAETMRALWRAEWDRLKATDMDEDRLFSVASWFASCGDDSIVQEIKDRIRVQAITLVGMMRAWKMARARNDASLCAQLKVALFELCPRWTQEEWEEILTADETFVGLLRDRLEEHFWPRLTQCDVAVRVFDGVEDTSVRERALTVAVSTAHTVREWMSVTASVEEEHDASRDADLVSYQTALREAAQDADDWVNILQWPRATELDRTVAIANLRALLAET